MTNLKAFLKQTLQQLGLDVRYGANHDALQVQKKLLSTSEVRTIVDGGAYHGEWTGHYREAFPTADVYMFEPFPESQARLEASFRGDSKVHLVKQALGKTRERRTLHANHLAATNSFFRVDEDVVAKLPDPNWVKAEGEIGVEVVDLDSFCAENRLDRIDLLKLDVQGAELLALQGAEKILARGAIDVIYSELLFLSHYQGQAFHFEISEYLHRHGYVLYGLYNLGVMQSGQMLQADGIFVSRAMRKKLKLDAASA